MFEDREYRSRGLGATIPPERLSLIGSTAQATSTEPVDHADVYAIEGLDHRVVVIARFSYADGPAPEGDPAVEGTGKNTYLLLREGETRYPTSACFFDPEAMGAHGPLTPEECR